MSENQMKNGQKNLRMDEGILYLVKEYIPGYSITAFRDLLNVGYKGLVFSKIPREEFCILLKETSYKFIWLDERDDQALPPKILDIQSLIEKGQNRQAIFIEGPHYLILKNGFPETLSLVLSLKKIAFLARHIVIISIDPSMVEDRELTLLEKETKEILHRSKESIPGDQREILRIIYWQELSGIKPNHTNIGEMLKLTRPTVRKKIKLLVQAGCLEESLKGRDKFVEITEKGKTILI